MIVRKPSGGKLTTGRLFFGGEAGVTPQTVRVSRNVEDRRGAPGEPVFATNDHRVANAKALYDPKVLLAAVAKAKRGRLARKAL